MNMSGISGILTKTFYAPQPQETHSPKLYTLPNQARNLPTGDALFTTIWLAGNKNYIISLQNMADIYSAGAYRDEPDFPPIKSPENLMIAYACLHKALGIAEGEEIKTALSEKMNNIHELLIKGYSEGAPNFAAAIHQIEVTDKDVVTSNLDKLFKTEIDRLF